MRVLFEDEKFLDLLPLVYFRPVWELRSGMFTLAEKLAFLWGGERWKYVSRDYLRQYYLPAEQIVSLHEEGDFWFVNGRWLADPELVGRLQRLEPGEGLASGKDIVAFRWKGSLPQEFFTEGVLQTNVVFNRLKLEETLAKFIEYPWDLIYRVGSEIEWEFQAYLSQRPSAGKLEDGARVLGKENLWLGKGATVLPGVVLNAQEGPIIIDEGTTIMPNAVLYGPLYVGKNSLVKIGAKIYQDTAIGPVCKVGGEIEGSIIQGYSNKQHDGFLGHAYLGSWVNIGADTNNSDLKNNYGEISVYLNNRTVKTGKQFLGLIMGDHSKTAINTMFNTGTVVGVSSNVFGSGFPPKFIPSFSWGGSDLLRHYRFEQAVEVAELVMKRRNVPFTARERELFRAVKTLSERVENRVRLR